MFGRLGVFRNHGPAPSQTPRQLLEHRLRLPPVEIRVVLLAHARFGQLHVPRRRHAALGKAGLGAGEHAAVDLCEEGDSIIINGGTTTFQMVHFMSARRLQVMTNSFAIAEHLVKHSKCTVSVPGGAIYRDQSLILSPFDNDAIRNFYARRIFIGAQGINALGVMESDALVIQSEQKLVRQAEELIVMVDSSKFAKRSSLILCALDKVSTIITDDGISDEAAAMVTDAGVKLITVKPMASSAREDTSSVA